MPSFATRSILATLCISVASAVPVAAPAPAAVAVVPRADPATSVSAILTQLVSGLKPLTDRLCMYFILLILSHRHSHFSLAGMKKADATPTAVGPIIKKVTDQIQTAITSVKGLKGQFANVVRADDSADEVVPLQNVAKLVTDILTVRISFLSIQFSIDAFHLASHPDPRWSPPNHWTYQQLGPHSGTGWVTRDSVQFILWRLNIVVFRPLLTSLLTSLIPVVAGLGVTLIPLVSGLLAGVSGLVTGLGLGGFLVTLVL
jgi:hypothetical protein